MQVPFPRVQAMLFAGLLVADMWFLPLLGHPANLSWNSGILTSISKTPAAGRAKYQKKNGVVGSNYSVPLIIMG